MRVKFGLQSADVTKLVRKTAIFQKIKMAADISKIVFITARRYA